MRITLVISFGFAISGCLRTTVDSGVLKCATDSKRQCPAGYYCAADSTCWKNGAAPSSVGDMAVALNHQGDTCSTDGDCDTGHCVDGVCCDSACTGQCQACDASPVGKCVPVTGAPHGARTACSGTGSCAATCNGSALTCTFPDASMSCGAQTCGGTPPTITYSATCDGSGSCVPTGGTMSSPCPTPANGTAICNSDQCGYTCNSPYTKLGAGCGAVFNPESSGTGADLYSVWGSSSVDVFVGGYDTTNSKPVMLHIKSDGTWTAAPAMPAGCLGVWAIWGDSSTDIYATSILGKIYYSSGAQTFTETQNTSIYDSFYGVWGSGIFNDVWVVGGNTSTTPTARVRRHSNGGWADEASGITGQVTFRGVWGSGDQDVYAVTDDGRILHTTGNGTWGSPQQFTNGSTKPLYGVWGADASHIYAIGDTGTILFSTGNGQWNAQSSGTAVDLRGVWGSGSADVYVVGKMGTILHSTGDGKWVQQTSNVTPDLVAIWGSGADECLCCRVGRNDYALSLTRDQLMQKGVPSVVAIAGTT